MPKEHGTNMGPATIGHPQATIGNWELYSTTGRDKSLLGAISDRTSGSHPTIFTVGAILSGLIIGSRPLDYPKSPIRTLQKTSPSQAASIHPNP
ncbi:hypothetical protein Nepgr_021104 [Nepenthes gracilis]|uniref:Uncharacterized protein n=1 Tax=Nepenthes gracilis TaxID=150966 RepID=A0AAD3SWA6_NEPGR|nr:hypothetical protein Nepgr_021104 [Nepenthes gracilis]